MMLHVAEMQQLHLPLCTCRCCCWPKELHRWLSACNIVRGPLPKRVLCRQAPQVPSTWVCCAACCCQG